MIVLHEPYSGIITIYIISDLRAGNGAEKKQLSREGEGKEEEVETNP